MDKNLDLDQKTVALKKQNTDLSYIFQGFELIKLS